jgi:hypothetical protein
MKHSDLEYFLARIEAECAAAEAAANEEARAAHLALADRYAQMLAGAAQAVDNQGFEPRTAG